MRSIVFIAIVAFCCHALAAEQRKLETLASIKGDCSELVVMATSVKCDGKITSQTYSDGRASFTFLAPAGEVVVTFSGLGSAQVKPDANTAVQPVDLVILAYGKKKPEGLHAVGTCRFTNPYAGKAPVECSAETDDGPFRAVLISNGQPPVMTKRK